MRKDQNEHIKRGRKKRTHRCRGERKDRDRGDVWGAGAFFCSA